MKKFYVSHGQNAELALRAIDLAGKKNVVICHNAASYAKFDGYHRYLILLDGATNLTIRSHDLIDYWETRYSRTYLPSVRGERECLNALIGALELI